VETTDLQIRALAGSEPVFDPVLREFLFNSREQLRARCRQDGLLDAEGRSNKAPGGAAAKPPRTGNSP
jgi:hypothetical protein